MIRLKSKMERNIMGMVMVFEDSSWDTVVMAKMPPDGDFRANVEFYDDLAKAYKKRLSRWTNHPIR